jgi:hypothetical protein
VHGTLFKRRELDFNKRVDAAIRRRRHVDHEAAWLAGVIGVD